MFIKRLALSINSSLTGKKYKKMLGCTP